MADGASIGLAGIHVGVLEQTELELLLEQALGSLVDTFLGDQTLASSSVLDRSCWSAKPDSVSVPPLIAAATRSGTDLSSRPQAIVVDDAGVGVDIALEAELAAQQVGHDRLRERKAGQRIGDAVIGQWDRVLGRNRARSSARRSTA
jgi:hypothetical protein